ncbi:hypothetical protein IFM89_005555 [Coptis chinensis]|uniref:Uncharacterized protein n=1 Tax=Coptis chinensis TaxID=261450 RepID=A0A835LDN9_9MAGN|nr:hypothetical protein IFM89_005555 [Coptis chinensis]
MGTIAKEDGTTPSVSAEEEQLDDAVSAVGVSFDSWMVDLTAFFFLAQKGKLG